MPKPVKRIAIADAPESFVDTVLYYVWDRYDIELTSAHDADFVFHSIDGFDVLKYSGVRIFITGENVSPNFAISDYALAFDKMSFGDRYLWAPLIKYYRDAYGTFLNSRPPVDKVCAEKTDFCAYVMSNTKHSAPERVQVFDMLSAYKQVNSGGKWRNNVGGPVVDKLAFQSRHKFVIAFENCSSVGYLTEKFAQAAAADAVPIYWGDPEIGKIFNPKAFVNCHAYATLEDAITQVIRIDQDEDLYRQMLSEPWFPGDIEPKCLRDQTFETFLVNIFDQAHQDAYRRNRSRWGLKYEQRLYEMYHRPYVHGMKLLRKNIKRAINSGR